MTRWHSLGPERFLLATLLLSVLHLGLSLQGIHGIFAPFAAALALYASGRAVRSALEAIRRRPFAPGLAPSNVALDLFLSFALVAGVSTVLGLTWSLCAMSVAAVIDGTTAIAALIALVARVAPGSQPSRPAWSASQKGALFIGLAATGLFLIWRQTPSLPVVNGWDMHTFLVPIELLRTRGGFSYLLVPPFPASAAIPYPGMFFHLVAGLGAYLGIGSLELFWYAPWFLLLGHMGLVYALSLRFSSRPSLAAVLAVLTALLDAALAEITRSPLYLTPDIVAQIGFLLMLTWFVYGDVRNRLRGIGAVLMASFLGIFYFYVLVPTFPFVLAMAFAGRRVPWFQSPFRLFTASYVLLFLGISIFTALGGIFGEPISQFTDASLLPPLAKAGLLVAVYSPAFLIPLAVALAGLAPNFRKLSREPVSLPYFATASGALFAAYWLPLWVTYRFEFYFRSFVLVLLSGYALGPLGQPLGRIHRMGAALARVRPFRLLKTQEARSRATFVAFFVVPTLLLLPAYVQGAHSYLSYYSLDEYRVARWIQGHLPSDAYIATDPGTGYFIRSLAARNASVYFILPDGRAPSDASALYPRLRTALHEAFLQPTAAQLHEAFVDLGFTRTYVLVSSRTPVWISSPADSTATHPIDGARSDLLAALFEPPYFQPLTQSGDVYLFELVG